MAVFNHYAEGAGNGPERVVTTVGGTITIAANRVLRVTSFVGTYRGAGIIRLRQTNLAGVVLAQIRFAADGTIIAENLGNPLQQAAGAAAATVVITEEGAFINSIFLTGKLT